MEWDDVQVTVQYDTDLPQYNTRDGTDAHDNSA